MATISNAQQQPDGSSVATHTVLPPDMTTAATQTDKFDEDDVCYTDLCENSPEFYNSQSLLDVPLTELDLGTELDCDDFNRTIDYDYEEVTIIRTDSDQKVGLTLCYGSACDEITDIYVGEVDPTGIAGEDGRIKVGDQILQINGCDIHTRQEAIRMFTESRSTITILVARPATIQMDDGFMEIYNTLDDLRNKLDVMETGNKSASQDVHQNQRIFCTDNCTSAECTTFNKKATGQQEKEDRNKRRIAEQTWNILNVGAACQTEDDPEVTEAGHCRRQTEIPSVPGTLCTNHLSETAGDCIDSEIDALNHEMQRIQMQYEEIINAHRCDHSFADQPGGASRSDLLKSPRLVPRMGTRLDYIRQLNIASEQLNHVSTDHRVKMSPKRSSAGRGLSEQETSAYNITESTPSTALELLPRTVEDSPLPTPNGAKQEVVSGSGRHVSSTSRMSQTHDGVDSLKSLYNQYIDVMYTNEANLQHTIMVQQNLFQQQLSCRKLTGKNIAPALPSKTAGAQQSGSNTPSPCPVDSASGQLSSVAESKCCVEMEWVVKRRADGSRYITRRPIRNQILKKRARKLAEERCGLTTDDDAASELKFGRYWSKEERKRHLEKARNHRRQKEILLQQQLENNKDKLESKKEPNAVELGHRKNLRHKSKKALDDFTTLQELMVHGSRESHGKAYNALLSVTTV